MTEYLFTVISSVTLTGLVAFLMRNWITERLRQSIKYEYDHKLEKLKSQLLSESNAALEAQKSLAARELEKLKSDLQKDLETYKTVANSKAGCYAIVWVAMDELVNKCLLLGQRYHEPLLESDELMLNECAEAFKNAKKSLRQVALMIGKKFTEQAEYVLLNCQSEIEAFQACFHIKQIRAGIHPKTQSSEAYDFVLAYASTRDSLRSLRNTWLAFKEALHEIQQEKIENIGQ